MKPAGHRVWFVACAGSELLDVTGPWAVLGHANDIAGAPTYQAQLIEPLGGEVRSRHGLALAGARRAWDWCGAGAAGGRSPPRGGDWGGAGVGAVPQAFGKPVAVQRDVGAAGAGAVAAGRCGGVRGRARRPTAAGRAAGAGAGH